MTLILGSLTLFFCVAFLIGLVKPSTILFWIKRATRLKIIGLWILSMLVLSVLGSLTVSEEERAKSSIELAKIKIEKQDYAGAISELQNIQENHSFFKEAKKLKSQVDSLIKVKNMEKEITRALKFNEKKRKETKALKEKLEGEIASINDGIDFSSYRGSVSSIQIELALFIVWAKFIEEASVHSEKEIQDLGAKLKRKVQKIQKKEFPILRKNYRKVIHKILWPQDIETAIYGSRYTTIQFTGGIFAANKNKQEVQEMLQEVLVALRFKRINYKWHKYDDGYTYYKLDVPSDEEISDFK